MIEQAPYLFEPPTEEELQQCFNLFDIDEDKFISPKDLQQFLANYVCYQFCSLSVFFFLFFFTDLS